ncbi:GNAT family N-acetyltransferase [Bifidobacterium sp.]|jgi:ElaA protein|uniref:GNAT family N-acetyltransferase n=1 Tax=Bifidobacterium sp. TaxID=41200 RepID=UPI0025C50E48|nr:GNAT family N-acetyltransferase [Bifidobacterium sp.]MCH4209251.1 GNAT family N-acetyltransferase [Bifidobacterium sp.]MCI1224045.1 GNAT family N-acetyltransferase [Bifidobacterium sp.]
MTGVDDDGIRLKRGQVSQVGAMEEDGGDDGADAGNGIGLSFADTGELNAAQMVEIMRERVRVFVVEQECAYQEADDKDLEARHVMLRQGDRLVAYARIVPHDDGVHMSLGRVLVAKEFRGRGLARRLVGAGLDEIRRLHPGQGIKIAAQRRLKGFYGSFGFVSVSGVYLEDGIAHIDMLNR